jgi:hypothetical protein
MSDPQHPTGDADQRDEQVASLLAVEPLDDLTRRRLVRTAVRATARRPWTRYAVAAAVALGLAGGGIALLVGQSGDHQTAAHVAARPPGRVLAPNTPGQPQASAAAPNGLPINLGDFGNLGDATNLARLRAAATAGRATPELGRTDLAGSIAVARACAHPAGTVTAVATGTARGHAALVLVSGGRLTVVVLSPCEVRPLP